MAQITVDTLNKQDRDDVIQALHSIALRNKEEPLFYPNSVLQESKEKCRSLTEELDRYKKENETLKKEIDFEKELVKELQTEKDNLNERVKELELANQDLSAENTKYKEKIIGVDLKSDYLYFKPQGNYMAQTMQNSATYIAVKNDDYYDFYFNEDKAQHQKAISYKDSILLPFCDIESDSVSDGNYVVNRGAGCFSLINGVFKLEKKARIAIIVKL